MQDSYCNVVICNGDGDDDFWEDETTTWAWKSNVRSVYQGLLIRIPSSPDESTNRETAIGYEMLPQTIECARDRPPERMIPNIRFRLYFIMNSWIHPSPRAKDGGKEIIRSLMQYNSYIYALCAYSHGSAAIYDPNFCVRWFEYVIFSTTTTQSTCLPYNKLQIQMPTHTRSLASHSV